MRQPSDMRQIDLLSARAPLPQTLNDVVQRRNDIQLSIRTHLTADHFAQLPDIGLPVDLRPHKMTFDRCTPEGRMGVPATLDRGAHVPAPVTVLRVLDVTTAVHLIPDLTLGAGAVIHDYLA